jgi:cyanophycin synthetase
LRESARVVADGFDRVVLHEDVDLRGRASGEVPALVRDEIARAASDVECVTVTRVDEAVAAALARAEPGDVVLVLYEKVEPVLDLLRRLGAMPVTEPVLTVPADRLGGLERLVVT